MQTADMPLSRIMQNISHANTQWVNTRKTAPGISPVALQVNSDRCGCISAGTGQVDPPESRPGDAVSSVDAWPWAAHRASAGAETIPWLTTDSVLGMFAAGVGSAGRS